MAIATPPRRPVATGATPPDRPTIESVFAEFEDKAWPYRFAVTLHVEELHGGTPTNQKVAEAWIKAKMQPDDAALEKHVKEVMALRAVELGRPVEMEEAVKEVVDTTRLNGFKFDSKGLFVEGRQAKAAIKEAFGVCLAVGKLPKRWGETSKGTRGFVPEHIFVPEHRIYLGVTRPEWSAGAEAGERFGIEQRFIHTRFGSAIQYEEFVRDVDLHFTVKTDYNFTHEQWAMVWQTGAPQGIGASRSQDYGTYIVTQWDRVR